MVIFNEKKKMLTLVTLSVIACVIMFVIEKYLHPEFMIKSALKVTIFIFSIIVYYLISKDRFTLLNIKDTDRSNFIKVFLLGIIIFILILVGYYLIKGFVDFENIKENLLNKEGVTKDNFLFVSLYISIINSFLEELFFRAHIFGKMKELNYRKLGYLVSPLLFSLYHVSIIDSWFTPHLFILFVIGLFIVGAVFNFIMEKTNTFLAPWIVHVFANIGINTIGFIMLGVI